MKQTTISIVFVAISISGCQPAPDSSEEMIESAMAIDEKWGEAFNTQDADALMELYWNSPELIAFPSDAMEAHGWNEVRQVYSRTFESMPGVTAELIEPEYTVAGEMVIGRGKWRMRVPTGLGPEIEIFGRYSDVKAIKNGRWVIIMEHGSVPMVRPSGPG